MGRMLNALRQHDHNHEPEEKKLHAVWPEEDVEPKSTSFIEVGGKETLMSADLKQSSASSQQQTDSSMHVKFQPLPVDRDHRHGQTRFAPELVAFHDPEHEISKQYRELTSGLLLHLPREETKVLLFTSTNRGAGTSTVLLNAALTLAQSGSREVLVVDAHLRNATVAEKLGLPVTPGLTEVLAGHISLDHAIQQTGVKHLTVLTAGNPEVPETPKAVGEHLRGILDTLRHSQDLILVDAPHWNGRPESIALANLCDAVYLCLPESQQSNPDAQEILEILTEQGVNLRGCIMTAR